jgi:Protein of unknown function (DUF2889)
MPIAAPAPRQHLHTRTITFQGYLRQDGLWDIEAELVDTRAYVQHSRDRGELPAGSKAHHMLLRVTLDDQLAVRAIESDLQVTPFDECGPAVVPLDRLVGARLGGGWRNTIEQAMGGVAGCTHLRELLFNVATAAFQTIPVYQSQQRRALGLPSAPLTRPLPHFGKCLSWDFNGPVMKRVAPDFHGWKPPAGE